MYKLNCFAKKNSPDVIPITLLSQQSFAQWLKNQPEKTKHYLKQINFTAAKNTQCFIPNPDGGLARVLVGYDQQDGMWALGDLPLSLPEHVYVLDLEALDLIEDCASSEQLMIGWGLGAYQYNQYKKASRQPAKLVIPKDADADAITNVVTAMYFARDMINTPSEDQSPLDLANIAKKLAHEFDAKIKVIQGEKLKEEYPGIYTVGKGSTRPSCLIDLNWGNKNYRRITLIGKGVCFDTGGLGLKPESSMRNMKKDMAGAAIVLGLARMIMQAKLPICLRVLIPAAENSISGTAYRPGDVIKMRNGKTVEIETTDAEGRLLLADALSEAASDKPNLIIDIATLTGAAKVALGNDITAMFSNDDHLAAQLQAAAKSEDDLVWQLPLYQPYNSLLNSDIADLLNCGTSRFGGAITAALFLQQFVDKDCKWIHLDTFAANEKPRKGRPKGGEAMTMRAIWKLIMNYK